jgi:hypothetical protein
MDNPSKELKRVQSGPLWADKKNDPHPVKKDHGGKVFPLPFGNADAGEIPEPYLI